MELPIIFWRWWSAVAPQSTSWIFEMRLKSSYIVSTKLTGKGPAKLTISKIFTGSKTCLLLLSESRILQSMPPCRNPSQRIDCPKRKPHSILETSALYKYLSGRFITVFLFFRPIQQPYFPLLSVLKILPKFMVRCKQHGQPVSRT